MRKKYVPVELWNTCNDPGINRRFSLIRKVPLISIKYDQKYFPNKVDFSIVDFIVENFSVDYWYPIFVNPNYYLIDGQHRFQAANRLGLKYMDVVVDMEAKPKLKIYK